MAATYSLSATTEAPSGDTVELRCPATYTPAGAPRHCGRLLAIARPIGQVQIVCPRCHTRHTFTFDTET